MPDDEEAYYMDSAHLELTEPAPALELEQAQTHAAQLLVAGYEKQSDLPLPTLIAWLDSIGRGEPVLGDPRVVLPLGPKLSTNWEN